MMSPSDEQKPVAVSDESDAANFLSYWFSGFTKGLESLDTSSRTAMLRQCGQACARSYTAQVFRECWQRADGDMARFLAELATCFPGATYTQTTADTMQVRYAAACGCDLVRRGWVTSPALCECSVHNLQANLEAALGTPVAVTLQTSPLRGGEACVFEVVLNHDPADTK